MPEMDIVKKLVGHGYMIEPGALRLLQGRADLVDQLLAGLDPAAFLVTAVDVRRLLGPAAGEAAATSAAIEKPRSAAAAAAKAASSLPEDARARSIRVVSDITNNSTCIGDYDEFVGFFRNRYSRLGEMIRGRASARPIEAVRKNGRRGGNGEKAEVSVIGMVGDVRTTPGGHRIADLEDPTGSISVLLAKDGPLAESPLLLDEVVGVHGTPSSDGGLLIASGIVYPDVPFTNVPRRSEEPAAVALASDVHVGSDQFLEGGWLRFVEWLHEGEDELAARLRYLVIAGDLVDGIGIYPGQEKELLITDVYEQYARAAEFIEMMPKRLRIVIAPGNHDAVRQAEPQPALPPEIRALFKGDNITFVGNPAAVEIEGVRILIYHGRSLDDLVSSLPGVSYAHPEAAMAELLKRRHLSPIYGGRVLIAPESRDHFVIDPLPDILHSGHVHTVGVRQYRGVLLANSGAWQGQTEFQKRMNIQPDPCRLPIVDLSTGDVKIVKFAE